jgi:hypothetical protein
MEGHSMPVDPCLENPSLQEKPRVNPSLALLDRLPRGLRDTIYDLCHQVKKYDLHLRHGNIPGTLRFRINAPLPQMRLINSLIKAEYESRAPASAVMVNGGLVRCGYTSSLNRRCPVLIFPPLWSKLSEKIQQLENTKIMLFELSVIKIHESTTKSIWMARSGLSTPPDRSFAVSLHFYDRLSTDRNEFMRVFGEFYFGYTQEFGASSST